MPTSEPAAVTFEVSVGDDLTGADLEQALCLLELAYPGKIDRQIWTWKYSNQPFGPPRIGIARAAGRIVGLQPSIRTPICWNGRTAWAYQLCDVLTHPEHRRRGIFTELIRAFSGAVAGEEVACIYTFPNKLSLPGFLRSPIWVHPFSIPLWARPLIFKPHQLSPPRGIEISDVRRFDEGVDNLARRFSSQYGASTLRNHTYLNWRYIEHPRRPYICLAAREGQDFKALAIGRTLKRLGVQVGAIVELLGEPQSLQILLRTLELRLMNRGARILGALMLSHAPEARLLQQNGYRRPPKVLAGKEFYFALNTSIDIPQTFLEASAWGLSWGNIDIV